MEVNSTKEKVVRAASQLFYQKGFSGTSVRDIAERAAVNVSLISYYFKGKQGLLEYAVTTYYETYLENLEAALCESRDMSALGKCKLLIQVILQYKFEHFQLTAFINRELSLDSIFVREMTVTYLAKEDHLLGDLFIELLNNRDEKNKHFLYLQLKGMIIAPFLVRNNLQRQLIDEQATTYIVKQYSQTISEWLDFINQRTNN